MNKNRLLSLGLIGLLLIALVALGGCIPGQEPAEGGGTSSLYLIIFLVVIFAFFYFVMIRPQRKKQKEHQQMAQELKRGDKIMTIGGIYGDIESVSEDSIVVKVESGTTIRMAKTSIAGVRSQEQKPF